MPVYDFRCAAGHTFERRVRMGEEAACACGERAQRESVYQFSSPRTWASEFVMPSDVRSAIEESNGYKAEAAAATREAVENGWRKNNG